MTPLHSAAVAPARLSMAEYQLIHLTAVVCSMDRPSSVNVIMLCIYQFAEFGSRISYESDLRDFRSVRSRYSIWLGHGSRI